MELKEFAALLNGREIGDELDDSLREVARQNGFVVIYGASDDLAEIEGAITDEVYCYNNGYIHFHKGDLLKQRCEDEYCPHEQDIKNQSKIVTAQWDAPDKPVWSYETKIPHEKFIIMEDGEPFCEGIVFYKKDIE